MRTRWRIHAVVVLVWLALVGCVVASPAPTPTEVPTATPSATSSPVATPTSTPTRLAPEAIDPQAYQWTQVAAGLEQPTSLVHAGDGSGRLFVTEQRGIIRILQDGQVLETPFLDLTPLVGSDGLEQGLLDVVFHPDYASNGFLYINYTDLAGDTVVARYSVSSDPSVADPASVKIILQIDQPYPNHNGGQLQFGPDGMLYVGMGDGGAAGDPMGNAQRLGSLLGKLLRLDVNSGDPYGAPPDNPFVGQAGARPEVWAFGLRNPWRFSFDRATGDVYIADVGQHELEEVNVQPAGSRGGENYGWDVLEGTRPFEGQPRPDLVMPVAEYSHEFGCSITGGYVYRGSAMPELSGLYVYGDWCSGLVWALSRNAAGEWTSTVLYETGLNISSFGEDEAGELYLLDHSGGAVYRWQAVGQAAA